MRARIATNFVLMFIIVVFGAPFAWMVASAFEGNPGSNSAFTYNPTLDHFRLLFDEREIGRALVNSGIVSGSAMVFSVLLGSLAGFGLSRLRFRHKTPIVYALILLYAMPIAVTMVAIYDLAERLDLFNVYRGLILVQTAIVLPFLVWLTEGFYDSVPRVLDEAAALDGAGVWRTWWEILTPVVRPGIAIAAGIAFMLTWAEVLLVLILISDADLTTISLQFFFAADSGSDSHVTAALGVLYLVPVLAVFLFLRRLFLSRIENEP